MVAEEVRDELADCPELPDEALLLAFDCWLLALDCWLLALDCWLLTLDWFDALLDCAELREVPLVFDEFADCPEDAPDAAEELPD